jgi:hypothetical protein
LTAWVLSRPKPTHLLRKEATNAQQPMHIPATSPKKTSRIVDIL